MISYEIKSSGVIRIVSSTFLFTYRNKRLLVMMAIKVIRYKTCWCTQEDNDERNNQFHQRHPSSSFNLISRGNKNRIFYVPLIK